MTSAWQDVQGDYYPKSNPFVRDSETVIVKDLKQVDTDLWQWKEFALPTSDYIQIVGAMTNFEPTTYTKKAYIGDTSVTFTDVKGSLITAYMETDSGKIIPTTAERVDNTLTVSFDELDDLATVTVSIL